jgi:hypothetical protein
MKFKSFFSSHHRARARVGIDEHQSQKAVGVGLISAATRAIHCDSENPQRFVRCSTGTGR